MKDKKLTLYIDESGKSSLKEIENNPFVMTGVIISDSEVSAIEGYFNYIKRKFGIDPEQPFHSYHIFEHPEEKLSESKLLELSKVLADFIELIPAEYHILTIDKSEFRNALGIKSNEDFKGSKERKEIPDFPYRVMSSAMFAWFADMLKSENKIGQIIADSRRGADNHLLSSLNACKEGNIPFINEDTSKTINEKIVAICFSEKSFLSGGLEITDLISYISYFRVRRLISQNSNIGIDNLWESISKKTNIIKIQEDDVRRFFGLKKDEVHKYLR